MSDKGVEAAIQRGQAVAASVEAQRTKLNEAMTALYLIGGREGMEAAVLSEQIIVLRGFKER